MVAIICSHACPPPGAKHSFTCQLVVSTFCVLLCGTLGVLGGFCDQTAQLELTEKRRSVNPAGTGLDGGWWMVDGGCKPLPGTRHCDARRRRAVVRRKVVVRVERKERVACELQHLPAGLHHQVHRHEGAYTRFNLSRFCH